MMAPMHWQSRGMLAWFWFPASLIYAVLVWLRTATIKPVQLSVPVICVGNNTVGGSGKTPTVIAICKWLQQKGEVPHVISRGYKGRYDGTVKVDPAAHIAQEVGDEPLLIARYVPCWVARKRLHAARAAIRDGATVIVMDDGLQNPTLHKTFSVAVFDAQHGIGNGLLLPAGPCREVLSRTMKRANLSLVIGTHISGSLHKKLQRSQKPIYEAMLMPPTNMDLKGVKVHPFAGIGNPDKFFTMLEQMGAVIALKSRFPDHHYYTQADLQRLVRESSEHGAKLVTTEKDAVKLPPDFMRDVMVVPVELAVKNQDDMQQMLCAALQQFRDGDQS